MNVDVMFSSKTDLWETPQQFFEKYHAIHNFQTDVCATSENAKCLKFYTKEQDALTQEWEGSCWMNPPYGDAQLPCKIKCNKKLCAQRGFHNYKYVPGISDWMKKAYESSRKGAKVVCLVPARTDTKWWHEYAAKGVIEFIRGRIKFGNHKNSAPFPSAVVVFQ